VGFVIPFSTVDATAWWRSLLPDVAAGRVLLLGAWAEGALVGTVQLHPSVMPNGRFRAEVAKLLVHRSARRQGIGRALMDAVEALARRGQPVPLVIAGSLEYGWQKDQLLAAIKASPASVRLLGKIPEADLAALISAASVLAYVPVAEGFGLPVLEAMACGTPVVASTAPAIQEVAGDAAILVDAHDIDHMAEALGRVMTDAAVRDRLRAAGFARAGQFSWSAAAAALGAVFDELE
jgi:glycosyltransferase involved in cell wall biosynthesis